MRYLRYWIGHGNIKLIRRPLSNSTKQKVPTHVLGSEDIQKELSEVVSQWHSAVHPGIVRNYNIPDSWQDLNKLQDKIGPDTPCNVEIGQYNSGEKLDITYGMYFDYLEKIKTDYQSGEEIPSEHILYLAQNDLPPGLLEDVQIPHLCMDNNELKVGEGKLYQTMLWMGPWDCVSPLHFDPLDNLLLQVVGSKRITLVHPDTDSSALYVGKDYSQQGNTSAVDLEHPDLDKFPQFSSVNKWEGELAPGDLLFIPAKWWHHVRSLDFSISVNIWWR